MIQKLNDLLNIDPKAIFDLKLCKQPCTLKSHGGDFKNCIMAYLEKHPMFKMLN